MSLFPVDPLNPAPAPLCFPIYKQEKDTKHIQIPILHLNKYKKD